MSDNIVFVHMNTTKHQPFFRFEMEEQRKKMIKRIQHCDIIF